jgi:hypothetical protein
MSSKDKKWREKRTPSDISDEKSEIPRTKGVKKWNSSIKNDVKPRRFRHQKHWVTF